MIHTPFFNPHLSYEENFSKGPFGAFATKQTYTFTHPLTAHLFGHKVFLPFGIPAGPLLNGNFVRRAFEMGFPICTYKTVRSGKYPCQPWPNVLPLHLHSDLSLQKAQDAPVVTADTFTDPISITNSFGVPSFDPGFWQADMSALVKDFSEGYLLIGSFQGTVRPGQQTKAYIQDFITTARLVKETGVKVLEVNLSCPNEGTSHLLCYDHQRVREITHKIKDTIGDLPLLAKIGYFETDQELHQLLNAIRGIVDGVVAINTIPATITTKEGKQALPGRDKSGVCGAAIRWAGLEMVKRIVKWREKQNTNMAIVGCGGVTTPADYKLYLQAGADAVLSATGAMWNPYLGQEIDAI